jgi:hypothetical protein
VQADIAYGDARLVVWLRRLAEGERTPPGTREYAWDAIEAITVREGLSEEALGPHGRRLVAVPRPPGSRNGVIASVPYTFDAVDRGDLLAVVRTGNRDVRVLAPWDGTVVSARPRAGGPVSPVLFWIRQRS